MEMYFLLSKRYFSAWNQCGYYTGILTGKLLLLMFNVNLYEAQVSALDNCM